MISLKTMVLSATALVADKARARNRDRGEKGCDIKRAGLISELERISKAALWPAASWGPDLNGAARCAVRAAVCRREAGPSFVQVDGFDRPDAGGDIAARCPYQHKRRK